MSRSNKVAHLEEEVSRLKQLLVNCNKQCRKQNAVYERSIASLGNKMLEFEKCLQREQTAIQNILREKDDYIRNKDEYIKLLEGKLKLQLCQKCDIKIGNGIMTESAKFISLDDENNFDDALKCNGDTIKLPKLSLPVSNPLPNISFHSSRFFRKKSKLSPVAEESEVTFNSSLRHVHADLNPEFFHAAVTSRLLSDDDACDRRNVTPEDFFESKEKNEIEDEEKNEFTRYHLTNILQPMSCDLVESVMISALENFPLMNNIPSHFDKDNSCPVIEDFSFNLVQDILTDSKVDVTKFLYNKDIRNYNDLRIQDCILVESKPREHDQSEMENKMCQFLAKNILKEAREELLMQKNDSERLAHDKLENDSFPALTEILPQSYTEPSSSKILTKRSIDSNKSVVLKQENDTPMLVSFLEDFGKASEYYSNAIQKEQLAKTFLPEIENSVSSSGSFGDAIVNQESKGEDQKQQTKKKKKKKKKKQKSVANSEKNMDLQFKCVVDADQKYDVTALNKDISDVKRIQNSYDLTDYFTDCSFKTNFEPDPALPASSEDKFSVMVDESLNMLDDANLEEYVSGEENEKTKSIVISCSYEDITLVASDFKASETNVLETANNIIDVSDYDVLQ